MKYEISLNQGNEVLGSGKTITANEVVETVDEKALARAEDVVDIQRKELKQLRNPWISVEERLPEKWKRIKVYSGTGEACWAWVSKTVFVNAHGWDNDPEKAFYDFDSKIWWSEYGDNIENLFGAPEYWMPITELKKGE